MLDGRLDDLVHQPVGRVKGGSGRLGDVADLLAAQLAQAGLAALQYVAAVDHHLAAGDLNAAAAVAHARQADGRLAGARFADQAEHPALLQRQRHVVHDNNLARILARRIDGRLDPQIVDIEQRLAHFGRVVNRQRVVIYVALVGHQPRPPFSEVVRFNIQSATRLTEIASVAMAIAG